MLSLMKREKNLAGGVLLALAVLSGAVPAAPAGKKAVLGYGWEFLAVGSEDVWRNREKLAAVGYDGYLLPMDRQEADGSFVRARDLLASQGWQDADFDRCVAMFRDCLALPGLRESLAFGFLIPKRRLAWTDDAAWANAASNAAVFARAARKAGFRGVCLDHEDYTKQTQFRLSPGDPAYAEACRLARRRGRQFFAAFFSEFPEARLLAFWLFTEWREIVRARDVVQAAEEMKGDLWHAFLNGMLDVVPPSAKFIDGNETTGYKTAGGPDAFRAVEYVRVHACAGLTAADVVREMGMRTRTAENRFRSVAGHSIRDEIVAVRVARAQKLLLLGSKAGVDSIFARCGYRDPRSLRYAFTEVTGLSPRAWRERNLREARG